jgi:hypothetical protein
MAQGVFNRGEDRCQIDSVWAKRPLGLTIRLGAGTRSRAIRGRTSDG